MKPETKLLFARRLYTYALEMIKFYTFPEFGFDELYFSLIITQSILNIVPVYVVKMEDNDYCLDEDGNQIKLAVTDYQYVAELHDDLFNIDDGEIWVSTIIHAKKVGDVVTLEIFEPYSSPEIKFVFWKV
jgi:hypothetical protein